MDTNMPKKLIEVALPLEAINAESAREKSIRHGHPSTLHLWWARRPLAAARAVIFSSLVDDPASHPELFPTEEEQTTERQRLFDLIEKLVKWENSNNQGLLDQAKAEILKSTGGRPPALLDPFAGGGAIPLEAQRLGLEAHASDLNPVAVMINKAMIEIPPKFSGKPPVNPEARAQLATDRQWNGAAGLAEDVRYYGQWMKDEAFKRIGHLYPKVKLPKENGGGEATVIAWIWARTVKCPNPACGCEMPLAASFVLSKKDGKEAWAKPIVEGKQVRFEIHSGKCPTDMQSNKMGRGAIFKCPGCGETTTDTYVKQKGVAHSIGAQLLAIVAEGRNGRIYLSPDHAHQEMANIDKPADYPTGALPDNRRWFSPPIFGLDTYDKLFTPRQLTALTTFSGLVAEAQKKAEADALAAGLSASGAGLADGGAGTTAYGQAVGVYLAFAIDRLSNRLSTICVWNRIGEKIEQTFGRQAIPMVWDYAETNVFSLSTGSWCGSLEWIPKCLDAFSPNAHGYADQCDAQTDNGQRSVMISTDPPYYDNIGYADLSDYFYIWMRQSLKDTYPKLFTTMLVPKKEELIATPYRFDGSKERAKTFFEDGMYHACQQLNAYAHTNFPITIYYAFKQSDSENTDTGVQTASTGWETMLSAIIRSGFLITGTWPMHTERETGLKASVNALASSIVLVCRKRPATAPTCTRRDFINALKRELKPALKDLQRSNIAPVDLAQSAIGPGMGVYSRFAKVLEADGSPMTVRSALQIINQELDLYFTEQDGELDRDSRFCVDLYSQYAFNDIKFGEADVLARAKNTSVDKLAGRGVLYAEKGVVRLLGRDEIPEQVKATESLIWLLTQQLTQAMATGGVVTCAKIVVSLPGSNTEPAKAMAYRLFTIADQKGWAQEAFAYNSLVIAWPEIQSKAAELQSNRPEQGDLF
jgi:putative DNA methylase